MAELLLLRNSTGPRPFAMPLSTLAVAPRGNDGKPPDKDGEYWPVEKGDRSCRCIA